jgi:hypothetical protein
MHSRILLGAGLLGLVGCGVFGSDSTSDPPPVAAAPDPPAATEDGGLPEGAPPPAVGTPANNELTNEFGVFVTATAPTGGDGTIEHPFATISAGIERVKDLKLRVYVCAGTYKESLTLVNAVSVISALSCDGGVWTTGGARAVLEAPTSPAIRAKDIGLSTRLEGFDVTAPAGTAMTPNSIALIAENAPMLTIASSKLTSAKAFDGVDGTDGVQLTLGALAKGTDGYAQSGPSVPGNPFAAIGHNTGRPGGVGSCVGAAGHDGESGGTGGNGATEKCGPAGPLYLWSIYSSAATGAYERSDAMVRVASPGAAGTDGASAQSVGLLTPDGYSPSSGTNGTDGAPGKGGGGGNGGPHAIDTGLHCSATLNGNYFYGASGAGGGAGGCPGLAGTAGGGGGASIAALVFASPGLTLTTVDLVAGDGGRGGKGTFGSLPQPGGQPGTTPTGASPATAGSFGGRAGFSGNGAGGPSAALAFTAGAVVLSPDTHTTAGAAGAGVAVRSEPFTSVTMPASAAGSSVPVLQF